MAHRHCASTVLQRVWMHAHRQTCNMCINGSEASLARVSFSRVYSTYKRLKARKIQKQVIVSSADLMDDESNSDSKAEEDASIPVALKYLDVNTRQRDAVPEKAEASQVLRDNLDNIRLDIQSLETDLKSSDSENEIFNFEKAQTPAQPRLSSRRSRKAKVAKVPCGGCGAELHSNSPSTPGYVPEAKFQGPEAQEVDTLLCLRCHVISARNKLINVEVDNTVYKEVVKKIKTEFALVVMVVDVTDMSNSVIHDYIEKVGRGRPLFIVGNKIDLIPKDNQDYLKRIRQRLIDECQQANLNPREDNIKEVRLVSAKTGYGIEELIDKLISYWDNRGDVYLVGTTNSGKSTLFNRFLESDFCKSSCRDIVQRATVSRWPGTTLNLIKFPVFRSRPFYMYLRSMRLSEDREKDEQERTKRLERLKNSKNPRDAVLFATVGKTDMRTDQQVDTDDRRYTISGQHFTNYSLSPATEGAMPSINASQQEMWQSRRIIHKQMYPNSQWTYDTPGLINPDQVINHLTDQELREMLTSHMIQPRVHVMKPGDTMFISGLARIDYLEGATNTMFTVHAAATLPVHVVKQTDADLFYKENIGTKSLKLPSGDTNRLNKLPSLVGREFYTRTYEPLVAAADLQLSSIGWVSFAGKDKHIYIRAFTPAGRGMHLRSPALLPNILTFKGVRIPKTRRYATRKPKP